MGDVEFYNYVINKGLNDKQFEVTAFPQAAYQLVSSQALQYKDANGVIKPVNDLAAADDPASGLTKSVAVNESSDNPITVDPKIGHQTVVFEYASNMTAVTIEAYYGEGTNLTTIPVEGFTSFQVPAEIGKAFSYQAPVISGHTNKLPEGGIGTITSVSATAADNVIKFYYTKNTGALTVVAKEDGSNVEIGSAGRNIANGDTIDFTDPNAPSTSEIPALANYKLVPGSGTASAASYDGINDVTLTYSYERKTRDVIVEAYDLDTNHLIASKTLTHGVGAYYDINALTSTDAAALAYYELTGDNSKAVYVSNDATGAITVKFWYRQTSGGKITWIAYYLDENGVEREITSHTDTYAMDGTLTSVAVSAPSFSGWKLADTAPDHITPVKVNLADTATSAYVVKFRYVSDKSTITVKLQDNATLANDLSTLVSGYPATHEVINNTDITLYAPHVPGYVIVSEASKTITVTQDDTVIFNYKPIEEVVDEYLVNITVRGVDSSNNQLYSYVVTKTKDTTGTMTTDLTAFDVSGYELAKNSVNGTTAPIDTVTVPLDGSVNQVTYTYESLSTAVTIKAVMSDGTTPVPNFTEILAPAVKGQAFSYNAPYIPGYNLLSTEAITKRIASVNDTDNTLTFKYEKASGNVVIVLKETDTNGAVIRTDSAEVTLNNSPLTITAPDLTNEGYTLISPNEHNVSYDGKSQTVEFYYEKNMANVTVNLVDVTDSTNHVTMSTQTGSYRVGETAEFQAKDQPGYKLVSSPSQMVIVKADNSTTVTFEYVTKAEDEVLVKAVDSVTKEILYSYAMTGTIGHSVTVNAPELAGWALASGEASSQRVTVPGEAVFQYVPDTVTVTLKLENYNSGADIAAPAGVVTSYVVAKGTDFTAYAPHIPGYVLKSSQSVAFSSLVANDTATFKYVPIEEAVDEYLVNITVRGEDSSNNQLYSYELTRPKNSGDFNVDAFEVKGYKLMSSSPASVTVGEDNETVIFEYETLATAVTIHMVDGSGTEIAPSFNVAATTGESFSYNAPYVSGYNLEGAITQTIADVSSANNSLTFAYSQASGNVTVVLKEGSRIIKTMSETFAVNETREIPVPDLTADHYTAVSMAETVTYTGTALTVEYEYTKDTVDIPVKATDYLTGAELQTSTVTGQRKGEAVTIGALDVTDYALVGSPSQIVIAGSGEVIFQYRTLAEDEVAVKAVSEDGAVLQSYVMSGTVGETITAAAPDILGWKLTTATTQEAIVGTDKEIIFRYEKDVVTITVKAVDDLGATIDEESFQAPRGGSFTAYAPHVSGYVLTDEKTKELTNITADASVTFRYKSIGEDRIVFVHYVDRANNEFLKESVPYVGKVGSELTLTAQDITKTDKVYKPESYTFNYVITDDFNQQHTFFYNEDEGETYMVTVHYVDQESDKALKAPSTFTGKAGEVLWLRADQITVTDVVYSEADAAYSVTDVVYTPLKFNHLYTITTAPDQQYTFHYVKGEYGDIQLLTINHLEAGTDDVLRDSEQVKGRTGEEILYRPAPITVTGVVYHPEHSSYRYTFSDEPDQVLTIQYIKDSSQTERQLTVKYLEQGTGRELAGPTTKSGKPGDKVTLAAVLVSGYTSVKSSDTYTFTEEEGQVYIFYYTKNSSNPDPDSGGSSGGSSSTETPTDPLPPVSPLPPAPPKLETEHHYNYINGYPDGTIKPENLISREEVAAIFYRLMDIESRANYLTDKNSFSDVASGRWSNKHISTMEHAGLITGYPDGTFKPGRSITRAEFAAIASRFDKLNEQANDMFSDIAGHWAEKYIVSAANKGWIKGYPDGTFKPNQHITRAEAMAFINRMLNRKVKADDIHEDAKQWLSIVCE
ncbi:S-layer homology domain-containing protein, partial [Bacillus cereus]|nr:S-layer homology domain-containing protein [Bacillus cereus]